MIRGLNHITFTVSSLQRSRYFYQRLGFVEQVSWDLGAYLSSAALEGEAGLWLCLAVGEPQPSQDYSHTAFSVCQLDLDKLKQEFCHRQWQANSSHGDSLYLLDPDDHKLELHSSSLAERLKHLQSKPYSGLRWPSA